MFNGHLKCDVSKMEILIFLLNLFFFLPDFPILISNATTHLVAQTKNLGPLFLSILLIGSSLSLNPVESTCTMSKYRNYPGASTIIFMYII